MSYKILVADDEVDALDAIAKHLVKCGYEVITATDGLEALTKIKESEPDIVFLDILMPKMNGFDVLKEIRTAKPVKKWQPVIIISSKSEFESLKKGYDLEADFYVTKPFSLEKISNALEVMISLIPLRKLGDGQAGQPSR